LTSAAVEARVVGAGVDKGLAKGARVEGWTETRAGVAVLLWGGSILTLVVQARID